MIAITIIIIGVLLVLVALFVWRRQKEGKLLCLMGIFWEKIPRGFPQS